MRQVAGHGEAARPGEWCCAGCGHPIDPAAKDPEDRLVEDHAGGQWRVFHGGCMVKRRICRRPLPVMPHRSRDGGGDMGARAAHADVVRDPAMRRACRVETRAPACSGW